MLSRRFRAALVFLASSFLIGSQAFSQASLVQAQDNSYWSVEREKYFSGTWVGQNFQCPDGTFYTVPIEIKIEGNFVEGIRLASIPCVAAGRRAFAVRLSVGSIGSGQNFQSTVYNATSVNPDANGQVATLQIIDKNTFNINASNPPVKFTRAFSGLNDKPNYFICSYYDSVARTNNCKYHAFAAKACRDDNQLINFVTDGCSRLLPGKITQKEKNCIRTCLVLSDIVIRLKVPSCQINCNRETCTKQDCIDAYHNSCFKACGVSRICYGGNWSRLYPNDDTKCLVKLKSGICLRRK